MSRETTFERDLHALHDKTELGAVFTQLCESVARDLQRKGYLGRTIGVKLRWGDFKIATRDITLEVATDDAALIRRTAGLALKRLDLSRRFRLLGVRVGKLEAKNMMPNRLLAQVNNAQSAMKSGAEKGADAGSSAQTLELF
jgi:DNA polymerase IV